MPLPPQVHAWVGGTAVEGSRAAPSPEGPAAGAPRRGMEIPPESPQETSTMADTAAEFLSLIGACPLQPPPCAATPCPVQGGGGWGGHRVRQGEDGEWGTEADKW